MLTLHRAVESQHPAALLLDIDTPLPVQRDLASPLGVPVIADRCAGIQCGKRTQHVSVD